MTASFTVRATRLGGAILVALAAAALAPAASRANHRLFERVSAGAINGNGVFDPGENALTVVMDAPVETVVERIAASLVPDDMPPDDMPQDGTID